VARYEPLTVIKFTEVHDALRRNTAQRRFTLLVKFDRRSLNS
jgi:hypothetical protein